MTMTAGDWYNQAAQDCVDARPGESHPCGICTVEAIHHAMAAAAKEALEMARDGAACYACGKPAVCVGTVNDVAAYVQACCNDCCGHGNEDSWCVQLPGRP